jgi:hypothetical protein
LVGSLMPPRTAPTGRRLVKIADGRLDDRREMENPVSKTIDRGKIWKEFQDVVNMTPAALEKWLKSDESRESGWKEDDGSETIGHHSGRRIVKIKNKKRPI